MSGAVGQATSATGFRSIDACSHTWLGTVAVVDKSHRNCPRSMTVIWDSAYQSNGTQIVECSGVWGVKLR